VLGGRASWDDIRYALVEHRGFLRRFAAEQGVQTNEVQRSWVLLPCFLELARRTGRRAFDLIELGPSAGLNLVWDRYRYRYLEGTWGREDARVALGGEEREPVPAELLRLTPRVRTRTGVDIAPIDVTMDEGARLLKSFVWADQTWRLDLLDRAIAALREEPPELVQGDLVDELPRLLARRGPDALTVVLHTAVLGYVEPERRTLVSAALEEAGGAGPLAVLSTGRPREGVHDYWGLWAQVWPGGERSLLAHADFHGAWIEWLGGS
jgi:hypothetical protein